MGLHQNLTCIGSERLLWSLQRKNSSLKDSRGLPRDSPAVCLGDSPVPHHCCKAVFPTPLSHFQSIWLLDCWHCWAASSPSLRPVTAAFWRSLLLVGDPLLRCGCPQPGSVGGSCWGHGWGGLEAAELFQYISACCGHLALFLIFFAIAEVEWPQSPKPCSLYTSVPQVRN